VRRTVAISFFFGLSIGSDLQRTISLFFFFNYLQRSDLELAAEIDPDPVGSQADERRTSSNATRGTRSTALFPI
jgi:hypothetical protein